MKYILLAFVSIFLISCSEKDSNSYVLEGNALGYDNGTEVFVFEIGEKNESNVKDTLTISNGKFSATYPKTEETILHFIRVGSSKSNILFFAENEDLKATIYKDSIQSSFVTGGKQNELYVAYQKEMSNIAKSKMALNAAYQKAQAEQDGILISELRQDNIAVTAKEKAYKRTFVKENGNSIFGLMLLSELYAKQEITSAEANEVLAGLGPKLAAHPLVADIKLKMEANKRAEIGGLAPQFEAPNPEGEIVSLQDAMGKYTIIDFWASWCRPCRMENPNVVNVYNKYHDKGLNIISVSLDKAGAKDRWIKAIADDKMDWYHVSNLQFWQDPIVKQYSVRSIPATFLLDENGVIIDKNLRGPALEAKIASLLD